MINNASIRTPLLAAQGGCEEPLRVSSSRLRSRHSPSPLGRIGVKHQSDATRLQRRQPRRCHFSASPVGVAKLLQALVKIARAEKPEVEAALPPPTPSLVKPQVARQA